MTTRDLRREAAALGPWFHNLHLPGGVQTAPEHPLGDFPRYKWREIAAALPEDLTGWRALDVGCNAGFYSIELARRGAEVTALDDDEGYLVQARFAAEACGVADRIVWRRAQVYELARDDETWDLVLFLGVMYHLRYPMLGLDVVAGKTRRTLIVQCLTMPGEAVVEPPDDLAMDRRSALLDPGWPKLAFIEKSLAGDPTNWWAPNHACLEAMLRAAGLTVVSRPGMETYVCEPDAQRPSAIWTWDARQYAAATGRPVTGSR